MACERDLLKTLAEKVRQDMLEVYPVVWSRQDWNLFDLEGGGFRFFDDDFTGGCAVASYMLQLLARRHGMELVLAAHTNHVWCRTCTDTVHVVDPTFSQFSEKKPILVSHVPTHHHEPPDDDGVLLGEAAKTKIQMYPIVQNPFSRYHAPRIQKWLRTL